MATRLKLERKPALVGAVIAYVSEPKDASLSALIIASESYHAAGALDAGWRAQHSPMEIPTSATREELAKTVQDAAAAYEAAEHPDTQFHHLLDAVQAYARASESRPALAKQSARSAFLLELEQFLSGHGADGFDRLIEKMQQYHAAGLEDSEDWESAHTSAKTAFMEALAQAASKRTGRLTAIPASGQGEQEAVESKGVQGEPETALDFASHGMLLKERMMEAVRHYCSGGHRRYAENEFHTMYHAVMAYAESDAGKAERKAKQVAYAPAPLPSRLMQQRPSSDALKLLEEIRTARVLTKTFTTTIESKLIKLYGYLRPLENLATRDAVMPELAKMFPGFTQICREGVLELLEHYLAPTLYPDLDPEEEAVLVANRNDLLLGDQSRKEAATALLRAGIVGKGKEDALLFCDTVNLGSKTALGTQDPDLRMQVIIETVLAVTNNDRNIRSLSSYDEEVHDHWEKTVDKIRTLVLDEAEKLRNGLTLAYQHALTATGPDGAAQLDFLTPRLQQTRAALRLTRDLPATKAAWQTAEALRTTEQAYDDLAFGIPRLDADRARRNELEAQLPSSYLESAAFQHTGKPLPGFGQTGRKLSLEEYAYRQSQVDAQLVKREIENNPDVYEDLLNDKHKFDAAWEKVAFGEPKEPGRAKAIAYLSKLPELQKELQALKKAQPQLDEPVVTLLQARLELRQIFTKRLVDMARVRLTLLKQREAPPPYHEQ